MSNGSNDYLIPLGIDMNPFFKSLNDAEKGVDQLASDTTDAGKAMTKSFGDAATAADKLGTQITESAAQAAALRDQAKELGKDLGNALNGKAVGNDMGAKIKQFNDLLTKFSKDASKPIKFNIDAAKLAEFEKLIESGADELEVLNGVLEATRQALAELDPNSKEFADLNAQLQIAEGFLEGLGTVTAQVTEKNVSLKGELKQIKAALAEMEQAGKGNTDEFLKLSIRAGELEDQIGDVSQRVKVLASDTKYLDAGVQAVQALAGAFAAGQGALAAFGLENEEAQKVIQKVTGAMAILQGVQAIANVLNKDSALMVLLNNNAKKAAVVTTEALTGATAAETTVTVGATAATKGLTTALLANPITAIIVGITALVAIIIAFTDSTSEAEKATKALNEALEDQKRILDLDEKSLQRRTDLLVAQAKTAGKTEAEITAIEGKGIADRINLRQQAYNDFVKLYNNQDARAHLSADDNKKLEDELIERQSQLADDQNALAIKRLDQQKQIADKEKELSKKAIEQAKKDAEERKKIIEQQIKFTAELEKARIEGMQEGYDKERAQANAAAQERIAQLNAEKSLSAKAEADKQAIIKQVKKNLAGELLDIDKKQLAETAALQLKASQMIIDLREEGIVKEVETIRLSYLEKKKEIEEQFKNETALRTQLIEQLNDAQIRETKKATDKFKLETIAKQEERAVLEVETAKKFLPDLPGIEEQKQVEILKVKIKYAEDYLQALIDQGNAENSTVVLQAKKAIQDLNKALKGAVEDEAKATGGIDWFDLLGLGELSEDQRQKVVDASKAALSAISEITGFIVDQYQTQIDKKKEVIDQYDDEIDDLEDRIDKEKQLREDGFANNVELLEAELAEKKKAKEEEIKQAEELQRRQAAVQKLQLIADTAAQASNLITSSTQIFKSLSGIPFIGVPLAIATIALMTGAFVASKVKAFQLVNDQKQSFGAGGMIDGKPHTQGGKKYQAIDGSGDVVELEAGEYVTSKKQTQKYSNLLEAINNDDLAGMNEEALRDMLGSMGIRLSAEKPSEVIQMIRERDEARANIYIAPGGDIGGDVKEINQSVTYLAAQERARVERWEDEKYYFERTGNRTTKTKK